MYLHFAQLHDTVFYNFHVVEINRTPYSSCRDVHPSNGDGEYSIDPTLSGNPFTVYCDMNTDGGKSKLK